MNNAFIRELIRQADDMTVAQAVRLMPEADIAEMARAHFGLDGDEQPKTVVSVTTAPKAKRGRKPGAVKAAPKVSENAVYAVKESVSKGYDTIGAISGNTGFGRQTVTKALAQLKTDGWLTQIGKRNAKFAPLTAANGAAEHASL